MLYLITHGDREYGPDPVHTPKGIGQIKALWPAIDKLTVTVFVVGTGKRFQEVLQNFPADLCPDAPIKFSPLCGSADGLEKDGSVILTNGQIVQMDDYLSILNCFAIDVWRFINDLPDNTLLCAGGELMTALGFKDLNQKGHLYEIDPATKTCRLIA